MATILVTGSEGNIGTFLVRQIKTSRPDWTVVRIKHASGPPKYNKKNNYYEGDLQDRNLLEIITRNHDLNYVLHAASMAYRHGGYNESTYSILESDSRILLNVLEFSKNINHFIYISSAVVYENADCPNLSEDLLTVIPAPTSSYGVAKYFGEKMVQSFHAQFGIPFTIWRPFNIVSPLELHQGTGRHVFIDFYRNLFLERVSKMAIMGSGQQVRCFLWVEDAAECIVDNIDNSDATNEIFNLGRCEPKTLIELKDELLAIGKSLGCFPKNYNPVISLGSSFPGVDSELRVPSMIKVKEILGWESKTAFRRCFENFIKHKADL